MLRFPLFMYVILFKKIFKGQTPLYLASASLSIDAVGALLSHYANRNLGDNMDRTPLMIAKEVRNVYY